MVTENMPLLADTGAVPTASFTAALSTASGRQLPQAIAHRGYKAAFPENTMGAFKGAISVGSHAIETDLHLSQDGVVVLSHDATLKRCFGLDLKIADCTWSYLSTLTTLLEPKQHLPRLLDLLAYLTQPGHESIWLLLDIKTDDDASDLLTALASTLASVPSPKPWSERVVLGAWNENYFTLSRTILPAYPLAYIGFSTLFVRRFLSQPDVNYNLLQKSLVGPAGGSLMRAIRKAGRNLYVWTVNEEHWMEWSIRKGVDGVVTDDPKLFLEVCERYPEKRVKRGVVKTVRSYAGALFMQGVAAVLMVVFWRRLGRLGKRKGVKV
ncbi:hypothetical protein OQA88_3413 [Cercophora sp. LCS_1]